MKTPITQLDLFEQEGLPPPISAPTPVGGVHKGPFPLSFSQQRLWFLDQLEPESPLYNCPKALQLNGALDLQALSKALDLIVERHEILRTSIVTLSGVPMQVVGKSRQVEVKYMDFSDRSRGNLESEIHELLKSEARRPFNLSSDLMLRAMIVRLAENDHVLLLVVHHIASDGWSENILLQELGALYAAFRSDLPSPLGDLPIQYADFALWQRQRLQGELLETQLSYWRQQLTGISPLELPTAKPRPPVRRFRGAKRSLVLPSKLIDELKAMSLKARTTLFMIFLAAFKVLLHRYTGQEDVVVGSAIANRTTPELEGLIGFFVNTLVLRSDLSGNPRFLELLARLRNVALDAYEHQDLPFEKLVEELNPDRDLSRSPLFQVLVVYQNTPRSPISLPGLTVTSVDLDMGTEKFDLTLSIEADSNAHRLRLQYDVELFDDATITRMLHHYQTVLEGIVSDPELRLSDLPILTEAERRQAVIKWNKTKKALPDPRCVHGLVEARAQNSPEAVAVVFQDRRLTYRELNERANQLAHHLQKMGVGQEVLVGIYMQRSLEMVVALLAVLKAGGAYVPLDPSYPEERLVLLLQNCRPKLLLSQCSVISKLASCSAKVICLDDTPRPIVEESRDNPVASATPETLAYIIYTSGSTGKPKGVAVAHGSAVALIEWARSIFSDEELSGVLASTSICFDLSVFELFVPLSSGGTVIIAENVLQFPAIAATADVKLINTVPSALAELLRDWRLPDSVRVANLAGEPLRTPLVKQIYESGKIKKVFDLYGPTEDTVYSTFALRAIDGAETIGRPITDTQVYILDGYLNPQPIGVPGELHVGGKGLARGYLNRPDLTAEKFIPNPFSAEPGAVLYKTGDMARYFPDGNIELLGRKDHQIKFRGYRIELGEIESTLSRHSQVREVVVVARENSAEQKQLVAYVIAQSGSRCTADMLRSFLKSQLPEYMVPTLFVFLDTMPRTPNGKVDRKALPAPDRSRPDLNEPFVAPATPMERMIAEIWAKVLQIEKVGARDNFFEIGGHSLLVVQVLSRIRKIFHVDISVRTFFENPTVVELAARIAPDQENKALSDNLLEMLADVESISDEEAAGLLAHGARKTI